MTTSPETDWMKHPEIRELLARASSLTLSERLTLVKGLVPRIADHLTDDEFEAFIEELRLKARRYHEAEEHPGEGRLQRQTPGERELEGR
jgi:hypothetical protein